MVESRKGLLHGLARAIGLKTHEQALDQLLPIDTGSRVVPECPTS